MSAETTGSNYRVVVLAGVFMLACAGVSRAQDAATEPATANASVAAPTNTADASLREVLNRLQELQGQVQSLKAQLDQTRAEQQKNLDETKALRSELEKAKARLAETASAATPPAGASSALANAAYGNSADGSSAASAVQPEAPARSTGAAGAAPQQSLEDRLSRIEENQEFIDAKVNDQSQEKVESGSKYRVRLSGIFLANVFGNRGNVDSIDFPELAQEPGTLDSAGSFGGSIRQSQIGIEGFGPDIAGAHTRASLRFDFSGGFPDESNGVAMGVMRLRTGIFAMDWKNTSLIAGQDTLFFAPLAPTSLATMAVPAMSYAGNLWGWTPQVRIEHRIAVSENSHVTVAGGILDPLSGDGVEETGIDRPPSWGEESGIPAFATHVAWTGNSNGQAWTVGAGGYYGRQYWGFGRNVDMWTSTVDFKTPLTKLFELSAEFYRGRAVGGLGGGIGQSVLFSGSLIDPASSVHGLDSLGGWAQLKYKVRPNFEINGAFGQDNPFAADLREFPVVVSEYEDALGRNRMWFVNFIYQTRSNVLFSGEFRRMRTFETAPDSYSANHVNFSLGYIF